MVKALCRALQTGLLLLLFPPLFAADTVDPAVPFNGGALIFSFDGLEQGRPYSLELVTPQKMTIGFRATEDRTRVLAGLGLSASGVLRWRLRSDGKTVRSNRVMIARRAYKRVSFNVDSRFSAPPAALAKRIREESGLLRAVRQTFSTDCDYRNAVALPVPEVAGWSNDFGRTRVMNSVWTDVHTASDLTAKKGTPVSAFCAGRVALAEDLYYGGRTVMIDHGLGLVSMYCHLSEIFVMEGEQIRSGECLGLSGDTGCVTAPHLHFAAYINAVAVDPVDLVSRMKVVWGAAERSGPGQAREDQ